jgi:hypothetical protein
MSFNTRGTLRAELAVTAQSEIETALQVPMRTQATRQSRSYRFLCLLHLQRTLLGFDI